MNVCNMLKNSINAATLIDMVYSNRMASCIDALAFQLQVSIFLTVRCFSVSETRNSQHMPELFCFSSHQKFDKSNFYVLGLEPRKIKRQAVVDQQ